MPPAVDFVDVLQWIPMQSYVLPHLPPPLFKLAYPMHKLSNATLITSGTPTTLSLGTASSTTTSHTHSYDTLSTLMMHTLCTPGGNTSTTISQHGTFQANLHPDSTSKALAPPSVKLRDIIGLDALPTMDDGTPICLSFHLHQGCWSNCKWVCNHSSSLAPSEKQCLANFVTSKVVALKLAPVP
jgi:hypothetical protein